jgi:hypothetical protein
MTVGLEAMKACLGKTEASMQIIQEEIEAEIMPELEEMNVTELYILYVYSRGGPQTAPAPRPFLIYCAFPYT